MLPESNDNTSLNDAASADLFDPPEALPHRNPRAHRPPPGRMFDGSTYSPGHDAERLGTQLVRVLSLMADGQWRTLPEIQSRVGGSESGVSARLRDLRKERFGAHTVDRRRRGGRGGVYEYRLILRQQDQAGPAGGDG